MTRPDTGLRLAVALVALVAALLPAGVVLAAPVPAAPVLNAPLSAAAAPTLDAVIGRAGTYVAEFHRRFSRLVAEEEYTQAWETIWSGQRHGATKHGERVLRSDLLLVKPRGVADWLQYRDVFAVDGQPVRERSDRLDELLRGDAPAEALADRIRRESAKYNIGDILRDVNIPVLALRFLLPDTQSRFRFTRAGDRDVTTAHLAPDGRGVFRVTTEVWAIDYEEVRHPTIIRTPAHKDLPAHGRFWIDPDTGRVLITELRAGNKNVRGAIDVSYQSEPVLDLLVPVEMREEYFDQSGSHITGIATYGRFRPIAE
jgi:hypothetical protein